MSPPRELDFDQTERITARLADLVRGYPKGVGLIKEFLQNADDAGAQTLRVIYDQRQHPGAMDNDEQRVVLGPALLFFNDKVFSEADRKSIQAIGGMAKLHQAGRTGRFGQGFNTCYSVTDHPSLLTGDWIAWFDPHHRAHGPPKNARAWKLEVAEELWPDWLATFAPGGWTPGMASFPGALFRLPLRSAEDVPRSEIKNEAFTPEDFERILAELVEIGAPLILFLRSIQELIIEQIHPDGRRVERVALRTTTSAAVEQARAPLRAMVADETLAVLSTLAALPRDPPIQRYEHGIELCRDGEVARHERWGVVSGLVRGPNNRLLGLAEELDLHREKAIPWVGAAMRLDAERSKGGFACFLPLPATCPWPVWLHGGFDLDASRRGITREVEQDSTWKLRVRWNCELLRYGVGPAWAQLAEVYQGDAERAEAAYALWPALADAADDHDVALVRGFYAYAAARPVFRAHAPSGLVWTGRANLVHVPRDQLADLRAPLGAWGLTIADPTPPERVLMGLKEVTAPLVELTAVEARRRLKAMSPIGIDLACLPSQAQDPALRERSGVVALARFCADRDPKNLAGLPLALLSDGKLHTFGECGTIYITAEQHRPLLARLPHRMLDPTYGAEIGLTTPVTALKVASFDLVGFVTCAKELLQSGRPEVDWLVQVFDYLERQDTAGLSAQAHGIKSLELLPDQSDTLRPMGAIRTPMLPGEIDKEIVAAVLCVGVPLADWPAPLLSAVSRFAKRHDGYVRNLTPAYLGDSLGYHSQSPWFKLDQLSDRQVFAPILTFLSSQGWLTTENPRYQELRKVAMLPTTDGSVVAANAPDVYFSEGFDPPLGIGAKTVLLDPGPDRAWLLLFRALGVPPLTAPSFIIRVVLPAFRAADSAQQDHMLCWLRDNLARTLSPLETAEQRTLLRVVRSAPILPMVGGELRAPVHVYHPNANESVRLLGTVAAWPDPERLRGGADLWSSFFTTLNLWLYPRRDDLLTAIRAHAARAMQEGVAQVREPLKALLQHVREHWASLADSSDEGKSFVGVLAGLAWLPAAQLSLEKVAAAGDYSSKLYKAEELIPPRFQHLASSMYPVLDGVEFNEEMAKALRLKTSVTLDEVRRHLTAVRGLDVEDEAYRTAILAAGQMFLRHVGSLIQGKKAEWLPNVNAMSRTPCVFHGKAWWTPDRVFLGPLPFQSDWACSLSGESRVSEDREIREGLERLGVRHAPGEQDWIDLLAHEAARADGAPIDDAAHRRVLIALQGLQSSSGDLLRGHEIFVPSTTQRLVDAKAAFIPDDPRLKRSRPLMKLDLVEDVAEVSTVAMRAGARSLRRALKDVLSNSVEETEELTQQLWGEKITGQLRAKAFIAALRRIAYLEALNEHVEDSIVTANAENFGGCVGLTVCVSPILTIYSVLGDADAEHDVVFESVGNGFLDRDNQVIWIASNSTRKMTDEVARAICSFVGINDTLRVRSLLEASPDEMASQLDDDGVPMLPENGGEPTTAEDDETRRTVAEWDDPHFDHVGSGEDLNAIMDTEHAEDAARSDGVVEGEDEPTDGESEGAGRATGASARGDRTQATTAGTTHTPSAGLRFGMGRGAGPAQFSGGHRGGGGTGVHGVADRPPPAGGVGSSSPWSPDSSKDKVRQRWNRRMNSYCHPIAAEDYDTGSADEGNEADRERRDRIGDAAENLVVAWERKHGRTASRMPTPNHPGWDVESLTQTGRRYIEVKGIDGPWTIAGVGVTAAQYRAAKEKGHDWWLYVVEYALDPANAKVHDIQNPFLHTDQFRFDSGWREFSDTLLMAGDDPPEVGVNVEIGADMVCEVVEAEQFGRCARVTLRFADGHEEVRIWRRSWTRVG